ncbi:unnamed protein product [Penicillium salamii]|uniref:UNC93-like protein 2 n=1 Tax=Penicillium salamii TaxID=1612424 RepID=A0A9W4IIJ9_9EURO|nr:unnamed protein product [Penicillium salamii]CAG8102597.1 unnamed protein product [Penicillium salamii]CAG8103834.1 unnamed protein product [Penicillium salamii]CAG8118733.1 unnamed protein product [Penicillium salamii]CAG8290390.1 unnamed protein product [Penicillium salamii]
MATAVVNEDSKTPSSPELAITDSYTDDRGHTDGLDDAYLQASTFSRFYRGVLFQMILFGALSFVGPAISDAISNLGGGGLSTPYLGNLANSLDYAASCLVAFMGGPLVNKFGIKWSCMIAAVSMPLAGSSYYVSAKYGIDCWSRGLLWPFFTLRRRRRCYHTQNKMIGASIWVRKPLNLSFRRAVDTDDLGLGIWSAMRSSGSVMGGAINFSTNYSKSSVGGIAWYTYLIFVGFECTGVIWAFLLSPTQRVRRRDGSKIIMPSKISWKQEFAALLKHLQRKKTWLLFLPAFYSFFYGGTMGTYLSLHFSVRARALSSLIIPSVTIPIVIAYGRLLDLTRWSQPKRAWIAFALWVIPQTACFIWIGIQYSKFGSATLGLDYEQDGRRWAVAYVPYLIIFTTGYWTQLSLYWILGTFSTDIGSSSRTGGLFRAFETAGQAVSYAINSTSGASPIVPFYVNFAILIITVPCMISLIRMVPEAPCDTDIDAGNAVVIEGIPAKDQAMAT